MTVSNERLDELRRMVTDDGLLLHQDMLDVETALTELRDRRASPSGVATNGWQAEVDAFDKEYGAHIIGTEYERRNCDTHREEIEEARIKTLREVLSALSCLTLPHSITPEGGDHFADAGNMVSAPPTPTGEAEPVAWLCEDLVMPQNTNVTLNKDFAAGRAKYPDAWIITPLFTSPVPNGVAVSEAAGWREMDSAPLNGKHCILAVPEPGGFIYSVQGAFQDGQWNVVHRDNVKPLYWMPNVRLPREWEKSLAALEGGSQT